MARGLLIGSVVAISALVVILLLSVSGEPEIVETRKTVCSDNLLHIWKALRIYEAQLAKRRTELPSEIGSELLLSLAQMDPPLIKNKDLAVLVCPFSDREPSSAHTSYRGPARPVNLLGLTDTVACCEPGLHSDGTITVLRKSGTILWVPPGHELYEAALATTLGQLGPSRRTLDKGKSEKRR